MRSVVARRVLLLVLLLGAGLGVGLAAGPAASAQIPGFDDCKDAPEPEYPGSGFVGQLDPAPPIQTAPGSVYDEVGYAGLVWHTYDLGCIPSGRALFAPVYTFLGNMIFNVAKVIVGATNGLHSIVTEGGFLDHFDDLVMEGSLTMYEGVFTPWLGLVGVLLGVLLFSAALTGDLAAAGTKLLYAAGAIFLASATYLTPKVYVGLLDEIAVDGVDQLRSQVLASAGIDEARALPNTLHQQVVYLPWLQGEFGSANSPQAEQLGRDLAHAQAFTRAEVAAGRTGEDAVEAKKQQFEQVAERAGPAYPYFQGINDARLGAGATALFRALAFAPFQLLTDAGLLLLQLLLRIIVMFGPVLGLVAILRGGVLLQAAMGIVGALLQALLLAAAGCLHLIALLWITDPDRGLSSLFQLIAMLLITALMWKAVKPGERFRSIFNSAGGVVGLAGLNRSERYLRRLTKRHRRRHRRDVMGTLGWWLRSGDRDPQDPPRREAEEESAVHAYAERMYPTGSGLDHPGLEGGPVRPEGDPGRGGGGATFDQSRCTRCGAPIDGWFLCERCQAAGERSGAVWAASERADRGQLGRAARGVGSATQAAAVTRGRPALPPGETDMPPARGDRAEQGSGQQPRESGEPLDAEVFRPDEDGGDKHSRPGDKPGGNTDREAWEIYRPDDEGLPPQGPRPEEEQR